MVVDENSRSPRQLQLECNSHNERGTQCEITCNANTQWRVFICTLNGMKDDLITRSVVYFLFRQPQGHIDSILVALWLPLKAFFIRSIPDFSPDISFLDVQRDIKSLVLRDGEACRASQRGFLEGYQNAIFCQLYCMTENARFCQKLTVTDIFG